MTFEWWLPYIGILAGLCTSLCFVPQVLKTWREGDTEAISKKMYFASLLAFGLWIAHGLLISSVLVILWNAISLVLAAMILILKIRGSRKTRSA